MAESIRETLGCPMAERPKKAIEVRITVSGFAWDSVEKRLRDLADDIRSKREHAGSATACGYGTSSSLDVHVRDVTPDAYVEEALAFADARTVETEEEVVLRG